MEQGSTPLSMSGVRDRNDQTPRTVESRFSTASKNLYKHLIMHINNLQVEIFDLRDPERSRSLTEILHVEYLRNGTRQSSYQQNTIIKSHMGFLKS